MLYLWFTTGSGCQVGKYIWRNSVIAQQHAWSFSAKVATLRDAFRTIAFQHHYEIEIACFWQKWFTSCPFIHSWLRCLGWNSRTHKGGFVFWSTCRRARCRYLSTRPPNNSLFPTDRKETIVKGHCVYTVESVLQWGARQRREGNLLRIEFEAAFSSFFDARFLVFSH